MRNKYLKYATVFVILKEISYRLKVSKVDARQRQSLQIDKRRENQKSHERTITIPLKGSEYDWIFKIFKR